jgi:hypothetical protein
MLQRATFAPFMRCRAGRDGLMRGVTDEHPRAVVNRANLA